MSETYLVRLGPSGHGDTVHGDTVHRSSCRHVLTHPKPLRWTDGAVALSLTQPWATLVVTGAKRIETRSWKTPHTGRLAIHAAQGFPRWARDLCEQGPPFKIALAEAGISDARELPRGALIGAVDLTGCTPTCGGAETLFDGPLAEIGLREIAFGDYSAGRYAWLLEDPVQHEPVPCRGAPGLWNVERALERALVLERYRRWVWADRRGYESIDWRMLRLHGIRPCKDCHPETLR